MRNFNFANGIVAFSFLLAGCASSVPPPNARFSLASIDSPAPAIRIANATAEQSSRPDSQARHRFESESFDPPLIDVIARRLAAERVAQLSSMVVSVTAAHVEAYVNSANVAAPNNIFNPKASVGMNIAANVLTLGVISLLSPSDRISLIATIELKVGDTLYFAQGGKSDVPRNAQQAIVVAVGEAINNLIKSLKSGSHEVVSPATSETPSKTQLRN